MKTLIVAADSQGSIDVPHTSYGFVITPAYKRTSATATLEASNFHQGEPGAYPATVVFENGDSRELQRRENFRSETLVPRFKLKAKAGGTWRISLYEHPGEYLSLQGEGELISYRVPATETPPLSSTQFPWETSAPEVAGTLVQPQWEALQLYFNNSTINEEESDWTGETVRIYVASSAENNGQVGEDEGWTYWCTLNLEESRVHLLSQLPRGRRIFLRYFGTQLGAGEGITYTADATVRVG